MDPENWIKILYTYGPFAILVFFVFVAEKKARDALKDAPANAKRPMLFVYLGNWLVIFLLVAFAVYAWSDINLRSEHTVKGTFGKLEGSETLVSDMGSPFFLQRVYGDRKGRFKYEWRLITQKKLSDTDRIRFTLDRSSEQSEWLHNYELVVRPSFYTSALTLTYDRGIDKLTLSHAGKDEEIPPREQVGVKVPEERKSFLLGTAYAMDTDPVHGRAAELKMRLESNDSIIRRDARIDLAKQGKAALPWIETVLTDNSSSYRVRLGAISALNQMKDVDVTALNRASITALILASADSDPTIRAEARRFLASHASWELDSEIDRILAQARGQGPAGSTAIPSPAELARTEFEVLYSIGITEKDKYGGKTLEAKGRIEKAFAAFKKAWGLRDLSSPEDRILFPKALYGWGHALHDRSWIEKLPNGLRDPAFVKAAQDKFSEFLAEIRKAGDPKNYPYQDHIRRAEAYIKNPEPKSLQ